MWMTSSAASSEDLELRGMWSRMWSSISSAMRLLMAPRAAERLLAKSFGNSGIVHAVVTTPGLSWASAVADESRGQTMSRSFLCLPWYLRVGAACLAGYPGGFSGRACTRSICSGTSDSDRCSRRDNGRRCSPGDVCTSGDGPLVDFGPGELDLAVASRVSFSL